MLTIASLLLRGGIWLGLMHSLEPLFDERGYLNLARAIAIWLTDSRAEIGLSESTLQDQLYGGGRWPPGNSMLLSLGLLFDPPQLNAARWVTVVLSALTTGLVVLLAARLASRRAAVAAGVLHLLYPTFVAFSHYVWAETAFLFVLLLAVLAAVACVEAQTQRSAVLYACLCGIATGYLLLLRAPGVLMVVGLLFWLWLNNGPLRRRLACVGSAVLLTIAMVLPWQLQLFDEEERFVFLTTFNSYNLAVGNSPWSPVEYGSSWSHPSRLLLDEYLERKVDQGEDRSDASRAVALQELQTEPLRTLQRGVARLRMLWAPDFFPLRHFLRVVYPPLPVGWLLPITAFLLGSFLVLVALTLRGLLLSELRHRDLLLILLVSGTLLPALTLAMSRLHLPLLGVLLPAAGLGLVAGPVRNGLWRGIAAFSLFLAVTLPTWPLVLESYLMPSSYYGAAISRLDAWTGTKTLTSDRVELRREPGFEVDVEVRVPSPQRRFATGDRVLRWPGDRRLFAVEVFSTSGESDRPLILELQDERGRQLYAGQPVVRHTWNRWQASPMPGVSWRWRGSATSLPSAEVLGLVARSGRNRAVDGCGPEGVEVPGGVPRVDRHATRRALPAEGRLDAGVLEGQLFTGEQLAVLAQPVDDRL